MTTHEQYKPGVLVRVRGREWVVLPETRQDTLRLRPLGGGSEDTTLLYLPVEPTPPEPATFAAPDPEQHGTLSAALLLYDAIRLKLRAGAGPFRSFGNINVEPRAYQLVPLMMALRLEPLRLLIADDVGVGKTIEAALIARELLDRGVITRLSVICPPHLCDQWQRELLQKFGIDAKVVRTGTAVRLERELLPGESVFDNHRFTVVSLDYIKSPKRYQDFAARCPSFVIVDEAHTCVSASTKTRHLRYQLIRELARSPGRGLLLLTATPHSGDEDAFHNLLGLINPKFADLRELEGAARRDLRAELATHFVQRRRGDIAEWQEGDKFPVRESKEVTYTLTGEWGAVFDDVMSYARAMVDRAKEGTKQQRRMSWWAALALLRCLSSSPAAALAALRTRLGEPEGNDEEVRIRQLDQQGARTVMDEADADEFTTTEENPAGSIRAYDDDAELRRLIGHTRFLTGSDADNKVKALIKETERLIKDGFRPVVFCRFIATAHYVGSQLRKKLPVGTTHVAVVTGELTPDQREERIEELGARIEAATPVLVATDCLSEGINLQRHFNAVVHYDLAWNPTRHEQREGRADRFGQESPVVRTVMLYGEDNPIDGAVLKVILKKAEKIRKELGVAVPLPADINKVVDAIMESVLFKGKVARYGKQQTLFSDIESEVEQGWQIAKRKVSRTIFAQRRLKPSDVLPEWRKVRSVLGGEDDVKRFVTSAAERLGAPLEVASQYCRLPVGHLPSTLQDALRYIGINGKTRFSFSQPPPAGSIHVHRAHALVSTLADYVAEQALEGGVVEPGVRAAVIRTRSVKVRTVLYLLRLRSQIQVTIRRVRSPDSLLAEECVGVETEGDGVVRVLKAEEMLARLKRVPSGNLAHDYKTQILRRAIRELEQLHPEFDRIALSRAEMVQADHVRVHLAARLRGIGYSVTPSLPVDVLGVYVFLPVFVFGDACSQ